MSLFMNVVFQFMQQKRLKQTFALNFSIQFFNDSTTHKLIMCQVFDLHKKRKQTSVFVPNKVNFYVRL